MKNILVTTDLSEESRQAFSKARELAEAFGSSVYLLAIIEDPAQAAVSYALDFPVYPSPDIQNQVRKRIESELQQLSEKYFSGLVCSPHVVEAKGSVHNEILQFAETHDIDMIVTATHGRTGFSHFLIGSVTERVMRGAHCPLLVVPCKKPHAGSSR